MKEIEIAIASHTAIDLVNLPKFDRDILIEQQLGELFVPGEVDNFREAYDKIAREKLDSEEPTMDSITLKKIVELSDNHPIVDVTWQTKGGGQSPAAITVAFNKDIEAIITTVSGKDKPKTVVILEGQLATVVGLQRPDKSIDLFANIKDLHGYLSNVFTQFTDQRRVKKGASMAYLHAKEANNRKLPVQKNIDVSSKKVAAKKSQFILRLEKICRAQLRPSIIDDFYYRQLDRLWYTKDEMDLANAEQQARIIEYRVKRADAVVARIAKVTRLLNIINGKLGKTFGKPMSEKEILGALDSTERKIVEAELKFQENYTKLTTQNKCPHLFALRAFRSKPSAYSMEKLGAFFGAIGDGELIKCNQCGFAIICPHQYELYKSPGMTYIDTRAVIDKYMSRTRIGDIFCRVCNEIIATENEPTILINTPIIKSPANEELSMFIWKEMAALSKYMRFDVQINTSKFISSAANVCYPFIEELCDQLDKSKTSMGDEQKSKKKIYTAIYGAACLTHVILNNKGISLRNMAVNLVKNQAAEIIRQWTLIIISAYNVYINNVPGITGEIIKNKLVVAFKSITNFTIRADVVTAEMLNVDSFIETQLVRQIDTIVNAGTLGRKGKDFEPFSAKVLESKNPDLHAGLRLPNVPKEIIEAFTGLPIFSNKGANIDTSEALLGAKVVASELFLNDYKAGLFDQPVTAVMSGNYISVEQAALYTEMYSKAFSRYAILGQQEGNLFKYITYYKKNYYMRLENKSSRRYVDTPFNYGMLFDEQGKEHKWDIYVIEGQDYDTKALVAAGKTINDASERKCSVCNILESECKNLDSEKILAIVHKKSDIESLLNYYTERCPEGRTGFKLHNWKGKVCAKCNLGKLPAEKYYEKWRETYETSILESAATLEMGDSATVARKVAAKATETIKKSNEPLVKLSEQFNINYNLIANLGNIEGQNYKDVIGGSYAAPVCDTVFHTRIFKLDSYNRLLIRLRGQLMGIDLQLHPLPGLLGVIDRANVNKRDVFAAVSKWPETNYGEEFAHYMESQPPELIVAFCLWAFCTTLQTLALESKLGAEFAKYVLKSVLGAEILLTKPQLIRNSAAAVSIAEVQDTSFLLEDSGNGDESEVADSSDPMSLDSFDMDVDEDGIDIGKDDD
jgi:hypothetical protein